RGPLRNEGYNTLKNRESSIKLPEITNAVLIMDEFDNLILDSDEHLQYVHDFDVKISDPNTNFNRKEDLEKLFDKEFIKKCHSKSKLPNREIEPRLSSQLFTCLSRHPITHDEDEFFDQDYGIQSKPLVSITTRSKTRPFQQQSAPAPTSSDLQQTVDLDPHEDQDSSKNQDQNVPITAIALPDSTAQSTAKALFKEYICHYGVPITMLSDRGPHFQNHLIEALSYLIGYNHIYSTTYHPQTNSMVERFNATFVPQLAKLQQKEYNNWDEYLQAVVFAYNTGQHSTTNYSPYELQFGRQPRLSTDSPSQYLVFNKPNDYFEQLKRNLKIYYQNARANILKQQQSSKQ
ncbi:unnamed protein product, partial [Didymodactylos carnosus]